MRASSDASETLFDNVPFDPKGDLEAYARAFPFIT